MCFTNHDDTFIIRQLWKEPKFENMHVREQKFIGKKIWLPLTGQYIIITSNQLWITQIMHKTNIDFNFLPESELS